MIRGEEPGCARQQGTLAGAVRAEEAKYLAFTDAERGVSHGLDVTESLREMFDRQTGQWRPGLVGGRGRGAESTPFAPSCSEVDRRTH
jgi:hypothetical protein